MAGNDVTTEPISSTQSAPGVDMKLEVVTLPVSNVDRAKSFYQRLGWRLDADFDLGGGKRVVQFTPPHSQCSIAFGTDLTTVEPGSAQRWELVVSNMDAAREDLISRGVEVSEAFHNEPGVGLCPAQTRSVAPTRPTPRSPIRMATAGCSRRSRPGSPAGNGRIDVDIASLADLLHETAEHHGSFEAVAPPHDWWDWYAAYMDARHRGSTPDEASEAAGRYMAEVKHIVVSAA